MNARDTHGARWGLLFRILPNTNAKIYLQAVNSNPLHQQLHPKQLSNHCSVFQGQNSCRALGWLLCGKKCPCHLETLRGHCLRMWWDGGFVLRTVEQAPGGDGPVLGTWHRSGTSALVCLEQPQGRTVHLELMDSAWASCPSEALSSLPH